MEFAPEFGLRGYQSRVSNISVGVKSNLKIGSGEWGVGSGEEKFSFLLLGKPTLSRAGSVGEVT